MFVFFQIAVYFLVQPQHLLINRIIESNRYENWYRCIYQKILTIGSVLFFIDAATLTYWKSARTSFIHVNLFNTKYCLQLDFCFLLMQCFVTYVQHRSAPNILTTGIWTNCHKLGQHIYLFKSVEKKIDFQSRSLYNMLSYYTYKIKWK